MTPGGGAASMLLFSTIKPEGLNRPRHIFPSTLNAHTLTVGDNPLVIFLLLSPHQRSAYHIENEKGVSSMVSIAAYPIVPAVPVGRMYPLRNWRIVVRI